VLDGARPVNWQASKVAERKTTIIDIVTLLFILVSPFLFPPE
jgi:hypothetical protein